MTLPSEEEIRSSVRKFYGSLAEAPVDASCAPGCCAGTPGKSLALGYSPEDLANVPEGANMGLGCGNPRAIAELREGEQVLDLGSGGGFDVFLAARQVGGRGRVIGVDMTPAMIEKSRANAVKLKLDNVQFRLGEIEHLPVDSGTIDVVLSNCVVNLSPDKRAVFREAFRVLRPSGRIAISDIVTTQALPDSLGDRIGALTGCVAGALGIQEIEDLLREAGFREVIVTAKPESAEFIRDWLPGSGAERYVTSASIQAEKPSGKAACCGPACCPPETKA